MQGLLISAAVDVGILLFDELISSGDTDFQDKGPRRNNSIHYIATVPLIFGAC